MSIIVDEDILIVNEYIQADNIIENSSNNGVIVENVLFKDGNISIGSGTLSYTFPSETGTPGQIMVLNTSGGLTFETSGASSSVVLAPSTFGNDNRLIKSSGTLRDVEVTGITISDSNDISGINTLSIGSGTSSYSFPSEIGLENQVLSVNSEGGLVFTSSAGNANAVISPETFGTDNRLLKSSGTDRNVETTGITISDNNDISGVNDLNITGNSTIGGDLSLTGDLNLSGTLNSSGESSFEDLSITSTVQSINNTTGALTISGGVGIVKNVNIGGNLNVDGTTNLNLLTLGSGTSSYSIPNEIGSTDQVLSVNSEGGLVFTTNTQGDPTSVLAPETFGTDNRLLKSSGTDRDIETTGITISDSNDISGVNDLNIAGNSTIGGNLSLTGDLNLSGTLNSSGPSSFEDLSITSTAQSTSNTTGALTISGGVGIIKNLNVGGTSTLQNTIMTNATISSLLTLGSGTSSYSMPAEIGSEDQVLSVNSEGGLVFTTNTQGDPTSVLAPEAFGTDNRLLKSSGIDRDVETTGISISDNNDISGVNDLNIAGDSTIGGDLNLTGDLNLAGTLNSSGPSSFEDLSITSTTQSTSNTTGALTISGGVGIVKNVNIGGNLKVDGTTNLQTTTINTLTLGSGTSSYSMPAEIGSEDQVLSVNSEGGLVFTTSTQGDPTSVLAPETFGTDNRLLKSSGTDRDVETTGISISDTNDISGVNDLNIAGNSTIGGDLSLTGDLNLSGTLNSSGPSSFEDLSITSTAQSINNTTGALTISGGVGIIKNVNIGGDLKVDGTSSLQDLTLGNGTSSYSMPTEVGEENQVLTVNSEGGLVFSNSSSSPNVVLAPSPFGIDNRVIKSLGANRDVEITGVTISDSNNVSGINTLNTSSNTTIGGELKIASTTQSENITTGALLVEGGVGVSKNVNIGGTATIGGDKEDDYCLTIKGSAQQNGLWLSCADDPGTIPLHIEDFDGSLQFIHILQNGPVGIGTITPTERLHIAGNLLSEGYLELHDISAPSNPSNGEGRLYKKTGNDGLFWKPDSGGSEVDLTSGGGGGGGDVSGPGSSTDNAIARFDGTGGKTIQNSGILIDNSNNVTGVRTMEITASQAGHILTLRNNQASGELFKCLNSNGDTIVEINKAPDENGFFRVLMDDGNKALESNDGKLKIGDTINGVSSDTLLVDIGDVNLTSGSYKMAGVPLNASHLTDFTITSPQTNQTLRYSGSNWVNVTTSKKCDIYYKPEIEVQIPGAWTDIPLNVERIIDSNFTHAADSAEITINSTDTYMVIARCSTYHTSSNTRTETQMRLEVDTGGGYVAIQGSVGFMYNKQTSQGHNTAMVSIIRSFSSGDKIKLRAIVISGSTTSIRASSEACSVTITRV